MLNFLIKNNQVLLTKFGLNNSLSFMHSFDTRWATYCARHWDDHYNEEGQTMIQWMKNCSTDRQSYMLTEKQCKERAYEVYTVDPELLGFELHGPLMRGFVLINLRLALCIPWSRIHHSTNHRWKTVIWSVVGNLWTHRVNYMHCSTAFYVRDLSIADLGTCGGPETIPHGYQGTEVKFWGSQKSYMDF